MFRYTVLLLACLLLACGGDTPLTEPHNSPQHDTAPNAPALPSGNGWNLADYTEYDENRDIQFWVETEKNSDGELTVIRFKGRGHAFGLKPWSFPLYKSKVKRDENWERHYFDLEDGFAYDDGFRTHKDAWDSLKGEKLAVDNGAVDVEYKHDRGYSILYYPGDWEGVNMRWQITDPNDNNVINTPWNYAALRP